MQLKYSRKWLEDEVKKGNDFSYIGFWGNKADSAIERSFSNFYQADFTAPLLHLESQPMQKFTCSEQYFMYLKAMTFKDYLLIPKLLVNNRDGFYYKTLGRKVGDTSVNPEALPYDDDIWAKERVLAMVQTLYYKFQNPKLKRWLLDTGDSIIIETSPFDKIWGIGIGKDSRKPKDNWQDVFSWKGDNLLGFSLMEVRDVLKKELE